MFQAFTDPEISALDRLMYHAPHDAAEAHGVDDELTRELVDVFWDVRNELNRRPAER